MVDAFRVTRHGQGFAEVQVTPWLGVGAPQGMPQPMVARIRKAPRPLWPRRTGTAAGGGEFRRLGGPIGFRHGGIPD